MNLQSPITACYSCHNASYALGNVMLLHSAGVRMPQHWSCIVMGIGSFRLLVFKGMPDNRKSAACVDHVSALCAHQGRCLAVPRLARAASQAPAAAHNSSFHDQHTTVAFMISTQQ
jgi:hypothetical protein